MLDNALNGFEEIPIDKPRRKILLPSRRHVKRPKIEHPRCSDFPHMVVAWLLNTIGTFNKIR
jgi:hypothetical protein